MWAIARAAAWSAAGSGATRTASSTTLPARSSAGAACALPVRGALTSIAAAAVVATAALLQIFMISLCSAISGSETFPN